MAKAYLTIDDSPSTRTDDLVNFLSEKEIPALFFCRGDQLETNPTSAIRAVQSGFVLGNHTHSHIRAAENDFETIIDEIDKTESLINGIYDMANVEKPGQYFRFPHLDRGCGSQVLDFEKVDLKERTFLKSILTEGLNTISNTRPPEEALEKKEKLQTYLKNGGYTVPFPQVNLSWYVENEEIQQAADCLFTFSTADWMLTQRHRGKWRYQNLENLKGKIDIDKYVIKDKAVSVVLVHDQAEIHDVTIALIDHMLHRKVEFLEIGA